MIDLDIQTIITLTAVLIIVGLIVGLYFYQKEIMDNFFTTEVERIKRETADKYQQLCDTEKASLEENALKVLNAKIAEKDAMLAEEKKKCEECIANGTMTTDEASAKMESEVQKAQEEVETVKAELQNQLATQA